MWYDKETITVFESEQCRESPVLGSDGKPMIVTKPKHPVGFDLCAKKRMTTVSLKKSN